MQSRNVAVLLSLFFFSLVVIAGPVAVSNKGTELVARGGSSTFVGTSASLQAVLALCIDLQTKIEAVLIVIAKLKSTTNIATHCNQIVVLISACVQAIVNLKFSAAAFVSLSVEDKACVTAIAQVCAQIIISIQSHIGVFSVLVLGNVYAVIALAAALVSLCTQLNFCIGGFLGLLAQICAGLNLNFSAGLCLTAVIRLLGL